MGRATGFLARLRRDQRGNALMMIAAMMIPLAGLSGAAIDMGRLYAVKSRLQQACDAGALAGRRMMIVSQSSSLSDAAKQSAADFFANNFKTGWYNTSAVTFTAAMVPGSNSEVQGTASALVPMTIMGMIFQQPPTTIAVSCTARYDVPDSDIMFVLDTTGSMADTTPGSSSSKIEGLKAAVLSFYDTLDAAKKDNPSMNIRYGFVTYSSSVNVGRLIYATSPSYLAMKWQYQTRQNQGDQNKQDKNGNDVPPTVTSQSLPQNTCLALGGPAPGVRAPTTGYTSNATATVTTTTWAGGTCKISVQSVMPKWKYNLFTTDFPSALLTVGGTVTDPSKVTGATATWDGCIEERPTQVGATSYAGTLPTDLDPDLAPKTDVDANGLPTSQDTRWRPLWSNIVYWRGTTGDPVTDTRPTYPSGSNPYGDNSAYPNLTSASGRGTCGQAAKKLAVMARSDVNTYVNSLQALGNTYHDLGMIWGTRLISPTGLFYPPPLGQNAPNRYIVFMTDGEMAPNATSYTSYGIETYDKRVTGGVLAQDTNYHNGRFLAECAAAKARNITVFTVGFGTSLTSQLKTCASPGKAFQASNNTDLQNAFKQIAQAVAQLRLSQ